MESPDCNLCKDTPSAVDFRCFDCRQINHIHHAAWRDAKAGDVVTIQCGQCNETNAVRKPSRRIIRGDRLVLHGIQGELTP